MAQKFYICKTCGKIIDVINETKIPTVCCGQKMTHLVPGAVEASVEKHIPVYEVKDNKVLVNVGSVDHPMVDVHYIEWVSLETKAGSQLKHLEPNQAPKVCFSICEDDEVVAVYAYCNLHGLWAKR